MKRYLAIGAIAIGLAACNNADDTANADMQDANATLDNMAMDSGMNGSMGTATNTDGSMANMTDPNTQNAVQQDMQSNDADTNLANGM